MSFCSFPEVVAICHTVLVGIDEPLNDFDLESRSRAK
jgi:hypothetical protein